MSFASWVSGQGRESAGRGGERADGVAAARDQTVTVVRRLLDVGADDPVYRDVYLRRARARLALLLSLDEYGRLKQDRAELEDTLRRGRAAVEHGKWASAGALAARVRTLRGTVDAQRDLLELGWRVYEDADVPLDSFSTGLAAVPGVAGLDLDKVRDRLRAALAALEREDPPGRAVYAARRAHFEGLALDRLAPTAGAVPAVEIDRVRKEALLALERGDVEGLEHLTEGILAPPAPRGAGPTLTGVGAVGAAEGLAAPLPDTVVARARALGLARVRVEPVADLGEYLRCCCAWQVTVPGRPLTEGTKRLEGCTCGHECPPGVTGVLKENLDLLMVHPFVTSWGARYLPDFAAEELLVEDFAEDDEADARSSLLLMLGLTRRRAVSRLELESRLLRRGPEVLEQDLGLDPEGFRLVCIPFDVYCRAAAALGWGQRELWTHFDGYQVWKGGKLRALVGGDVRFGGPDDLCSLSRSDERDKVLIRLAVVRRERLGSLQ